MGKNNNSISFGLGLFAGVVGGILAGVMYAPKPGEESRKELEINELLKKITTEIEIFSLRKVLFN